MFSRLKHRYRSLSLPIRIVLIGILSCGFFVGLSAIIASGSTLPFEDSWTSSIVGLDTGNHSQVHFSYGGNDFAGIIFWLSGQQLSSPEILNNVDAGQSISCSYKLRGMYYNNMRGWRLRPLDTGSLSQLQSSSQTGYAQLTMTGGLFTSCTGIIGGSYTPNPQSIYGQIDHIYSGVTYHLLAGVLYDTVHNTISAGSSFGETLQVTGGTYSGLLFDTYGGIALVNSGSTQICGNGAIEGGEQCDDGNAINGDGCSSSCLAEAIPGSLCSTGISVSSTSNVNTPISFVLNSPRTQWVGMTNFQGAFSTSFATGQTTVIYTTGFAALGTYTGTITLANKYLPSLTGSCPWSVVISTGVALCQSFAANPNGGTITTGSNIDFTCAGQNTTGYILDIWSGSIGGSLIYQHQIFTGASQYTRTTGAALPLGQYIATCTALTGNGVGPQCANNIAFTVTGHSVNACSDSFTKIIAPIGNTFITGNNGSYYTSQSGLNIQVTTLSGISYLITGQILPLQITGISLGYHSLFALQMNTITTLSSMFSSGSCNYSGPQMSFYRDTQAPSTPSIVAPTSSVNLCSANPIALQWTASSDGLSGVGLSGYQYILQNTNSINVISATVGSGTTGVVLSGNSLSLGTYNRIVKAFDRLGNVVSSSVGTFLIGTGNCTGTLLQLSGTLSPLINADIDTLYTSNTFAVLGLTSPTLLSLSTGTLFINASGTNSTGYVQSGDLLAIRLRSSMEYASPITATFSIGGLTGNRTITTIDQASCTLSKTQKLVASRIYGLLKGMYDSDPSKMDSFVSTMKSMLEDSLNLNPNCNLDYLLTLINDDGSSQQDTSAHITPSCKEYTVSDDSIGYSSPDMKKMMYFVNRESLIRYLDSLNPGDCHQPSYSTNSRTSDTTDETKHVAPNGKVYRITSSDNIYTSIDFAGSKEFSDLATMRQYINKHNPVTVLWDHEVDTSFTPITYLTANNKSYTIYKTNKGFMSYKLIKVRYFSTLAEIESYINKNNKVK